MWDQHSAACSHIDSNSCRNRDSWSKRQRIFFLKRQIFFLQFFFEGEGGGFRGPTRGSLHVKPKFCFLIKYYRTKSTICRINSLTMWPRHFTMQFFINFISSLLFIYTSVYKYDYLIYIIIYSLRIRMMQVCRLIDCIYDIKQFNMHRIRQLCSVNRPIQFNLWFNKCLVRIFALLKHQRHLSIAKKSSSYFRVFWLSLYTVLISVWVSVCLCVQL